MKTLNISRWQLIALTVLRILIGWHFLYEGLIKVMNPDWTAAGYLNSAIGPLSGFFHGLAANPTILELINILNQWGLVIVGLSLMIGFLSRWACLGGMALLSLYYLAHPPFIGLSDASMLEGNYLIVNKILIELAALWVIFQIQDSKVFGLDFLFRKKSQP